jgi:cAMP phosphodiesterase
LDFLLGFFILFVVPSLEETHFTVHERSVAFLTALAKSLSMLLAFGQDSDDSVEDFLNWVESIASEVGHDVSLLRLRVIVAFEVKYPESIEMGMNRHVQCIRLLSDFVFLTIFISMGAVAGILACVYSLDG